MMCMSLNSHSLPAVVVERQLRHIVLVGLPRRLDGLLIHNNELTGCSTVPATLSVFRMDCWVGIWKYSPVN